MNAAAGHIIFPPSKLEITDISKSGSILNLWVQEPTYSNVTGTIDFEGIAFNPGYQGPQGLVLLLTFKIKSAGSIPLSFSSASVLANDGQGTQILVNTGNALFDVPGSVAAPTQESAPSSTPAPAPRPQPAPQQTTAGSKAPSKPSITSQTHPDSDIWYAKKDALFTWSVPKDVTAVRLLYGTKENAVPTVYYSSPLAEKKITNIPDGTYWFHVRLRNAAGWGEAAHFQFRVDATPPTLAVRDVGYVDETKTQVRLTIESADAASGLARYEIQIDGNKPAVLEGKEKQTFLAPRLRGGDHAVTIKAFDRAGNVTAKEITVAVEGSRFMPVQWFSEFATVGVFTWALYGIVALLIALVWHLHRKEIVYAPRLLLLPFYLLFLLGRALVRKRVPQPPRSRFAHLRLRKKVSRAALSRSARMRDRRKRV